MGAGRTAVERKGRVCKYSFRDVSGRGNTFPIAHLASFRATTAYGLELARAAAQCYRAVSPTESFSTC